MARVMVVLSFGMGYLLSPAFAQTAPYVLPYTMSTLAGPHAAYVAGAACGAVVLGTVGMATPYPVVCAGMLLVGGASTIAFSALTSLLMAHLPPAQSGLASGLQNTTRQSGALFAVSVFGAVLNTAEPAGRLAQRLSASRAAA